MEELAPLVTRAHNGDVEAYGQIVRRFQDMAYGYAYSILGDFHLAEDVAQEAFIEAYRQLDNLRDPAAFPGWFRRIVFKYCDRITRRRQLSTVPLDAAVGMATKELGPVQAAEKRETQQKVLVAIRALPEHLRAVTSLFYINGYSHNEIGEFLEVSVKTVQKRLRDSRNQLKERMANMVENELKKHPLPDDFTQKVLTFVEIMEVSVGKRFVFQFANGVRVFTRIDKVVRGKRQFHFLVCGPTEIKCHGAEDIRLDSFVLIPSTVVTVTEICNDTDPRLEHDATKYVDKRLYGQSYEILGPDDPKYIDDKKYHSSPVMIGPLDIIDDAPPHVFGFIRVGENQIPTPEDIYVSITLIQKHTLKQGEIVKCTWRRAVGNERYRSAVEIIVANGADQGHGSGSPGYGDGLR
jgi:RNA polymerase sigma factor (sigma-70 family)